MRKQLKGKKGQMVVLVDFARVPEGAEKDIDFWSDHHEAPETAEVKKAGKIGATEFKSDTEHLHTLYAQNLATSETVNAVSRVDSATYTDLNKVVKLSKNLKGKNRMERLAILCNALLSESGILKKPALVSSFIKKTQPSLFSFYNNILEYNRLSNIQDTAVRELVKDEPDWNKVRKARRMMPDREAAEEIVTPKKVPARTRLRELGEDAVDEYEELQELRRKGSARTEEEERRFRELVNKPIEKIKSQRDKSIEKQRDLKTGSMQPQGNVMHVSSSGVQRFLWTQLHKEGVRYPFNMRTIGPMLQVSVNPDLPKEVKDRINLTDMMFKILKEVKEEAKDKGWVFKIIERESGGHAGITNITGLNLLGLNPNKMEREELKKIEGYEKRLKDLKVLGGGRKLDDKEKEKLNNAKKVLKRKTATEEEKEKAKRTINILDPKLERIMPKKAQRKEQLIKAKDLAKQDQERIVNSIKQKFQERLDELAKTFSPLKGDDEEFRIRESLLEQILDYSGER